MYGPNLSELNFNEAPAYEPALCADEEENHSMRDYEALALARSSTDFDFGVES